jgi:hypothetical protein
VLGFAADCSHIYSLTFGQETSKRKREFALAAASNNPSLRGLTFLSDEELYKIADLSLLRDDVWPLFAYGSTDYVYCYQWTGEVPAGWAASAESLSACEQAESLSHMKSRNPALKYRYNDGRERKIQSDDIFFDDYGVSIIRIVISPRLTDVTGVEKRIHQLTSADTVGFKGHVKNGGSPARQKYYVYGTSLLVIKNPTKLSLVVNQTYREAYESNLKHFGGREGCVKKPVAPSASFVRPPQESSHAFVLGGPIFELERGIITASQAKERGVTASQEASQGEAEEDDASVASWDGNFGKCIYLTGKTLKTSDLSKAQMEAIGGEACFFTGKPSAKNPMTLLVVKASSNWRKGPKFEHARKNNIPIITFQQLKAALDHE